MGRREKSTVADFCDVGVVGVRELMVSLRVFGLAINTTVHLGFLCATINTGYTAAFAPIGTACSIVLSKIVHKSEVENSGADGEGIKFATAKAHNFCEDGIEGSKESPAI